MCGLSHEGWSEYITRARQASGLEEMFTQVVLIPLTGCQLHENAEQGIAGARVAEGRARRLKRCGEHSAHEIVAVQKLVSVTLPYGVGDSRCMRQNPPDCDASFVYGHIRDEFANRIVDGQSPFFAELQNRGSRELFGE